jgi:hydroxyacylglutathione hydrolase
VLDTHTHADHLSGVRRLAQQTGATVLAHATSKVKWGGARRVRGQTTFELGTKTVRVIDAPGHTPDSFALLVDGHLFTGDALFAGGAGRTDFMGGSAPISSIPSGPSRPSRRTRSSIPAMTTWVAR